MPNQDVRTAGKKKKSISGAFLHFFKSLGKVEGGQSWVSVLFLLLVFLPVGLVLLHWKLSRRTMGTWVPFLFGGILLSLFYLFGEITQLDLFLARKCTAAQFAGISLAGFAALGVSSFMLFHISLSIRKKNKMVRTYRSLIESGGILNLDILAEIVGKDEKTVAKDLSVLIDAHYLHGMRLDRERGCLVLTESKEGKPAKEEKEESARAIPAASSGLAEGVGSETGNEEPAPEAASGSSAPAMPAPATLDAVSPTPEAATGSATPAMPTPRASALVRAKFASAEPERLPNGLPADSRVHPAKPHRRSRPVVVEPVWEKEASPSIFLLDEPPSMEEADQVTFDEYIVASSPDAFSFSKRAHSSAETSRSSKPSLPPSAGSGKEEPAVRQRSRRVPGETTEGVFEEGLISPGEKRALRKMRNQEITSAKEEHKRQARARVAQKRRAREQSQRQRIAAEKAARIRARERAVREKVALAQMAQEQKTREQVEQDRLAEEKLRIERSVAEGVARSRHAREAAAKRAKEKMFPELSRNALAPDLYPEGSLPADPARPESEENLIRSAFREVYPGEAPIASVPPIRSPKKDKDKNEPGP